MQNSRPIINFGLIAILALGTSAQSPQVGFRLLDQQAINRITQDGNNISTLLTFYLIREVPSVLDDRLMLSSFALLNNCEASPQSFGKVRGQLLNEVDFPDVENFYKQHATGVVAKLPTKISFLFETYPTRGPVERLTLGQYDSSRNAFPFVGTSGPTEITYTNVVPGRDNIICPGGNIVTPDGRFAGSTSSVVLPEYEVDFAPVSFKELRMDREAAKAFLDTFGGARSVTIKFDAELLPGAPKELSDNRTKTRRFVFNAKIATATILAPNITNTGYGSINGGMNSRALKESRKPLGTVYP